MCTLSEPAPGQLRVSALTSFLLAPGSSQAYWSLGSRASISHFPSHIRGSGHLLKEVFAAGAVGQGKEGVAKGAAQGHRDESRSVREPCPLPRVGHGRDGRLRRSKVASPLLLVTVPLERVRFQRTRERQSWGRGSEVRKQVSRERGQEQVKRKEPRGNLCASDSGGNPRGLTSDAGDREARARGGHRMSVGPTPR